MRGYLECSRGYGIKVGVKRGGEVGCVAVSHPHWRCVGIEGAVLVFFF